MGVWDHKTGRIKRENRTKLEKTATKQTKQCGIE